MKYIVEDGSKDDQEDKTGHDSPSIPPPSPSPYKGEGRSEAVIWNKGLGSEVSNSLHPLIFGEIFQEVSDALFQNRMDEMTVNLG